MENMQSETITEITKALIKASAAFESIEKKGAMKIGGQSLPYALLEDILSAVKKPLRDNGIFITWAYSSSDDQVVLTLTLLHSSGEWMRTSSTTTVAGKKAQDIGAWTTYMRRYQILGILGLAPGEDVDGDMLNEFNTTTGGTKKLKTKQDLKAELDQIKEELASLPELEAKVVGHYGSLEKAPAKDYNILRERIAKARGVAVCAS